MWTGAMLSSVGTWMQQLAQSWLIYDITGSARMLGLDAFLGQAPIMALSLLGGVIADRIDRRHILLASQMVQLSCAFILTALYIAGIVQHHPYYILCLSFLVGTSADRPIRHLCQRWSHPSI
jgi:MFS family permease